MAQPAEPANLLTMADLLGPATIRAAATLKVADHIAAGATSTGALAELTGTRPDLLDLMLRHLAAQGVLDRHTESRDADARYTLTELGGPLRSDHPQSVRRHLSATGLVGRADMALVNLVHTVRTGEPAHASIFGRDYWQSVNEDPAFVEDLEADARNQSDAERVGWGAELIIDSYDWAPVERVVDVGGHTGAILTSLLQRHEHLHGTLIDLKNVTAVAGRVFEAAGLADRTETVVGSFFEPLPVGGDVYLLSAILADWSDDQAVEILRRCAEAAGPTGKVLLAEVNLQVPGDPGTAAGPELWLRATMPAPTRTADQLLALVAAAGLRVTWQGPSTAVRSLLELAPAGPAEGEDGRC
ncbi:O-methyltransferase [Streptomyces puniciscabiei]|uniref:O-methyltransferase n=1 Tax=Streptomyces puniciscabiei TaxID=164348 RepID=A0A542UHA8_9ACTN|nr:methyltransferase [Streptomyces puniciscabiei]TQK98424.1 O-methyltransferase [Streptomyces puniciscabiei]